MGIMMSRRRAAAKKKKADAAKLKDKENKAEKPDKVKDGAHKQRKT